MARHLRDARPRYALVLWPEDTDKELPSCIELSGVPDAVAFGAVLVAKEDAEFCQPRSPVKVDPMVLKHPYRRDANWRPDESDGA
jgi:hypothetical protein